MVLKGSWTSKLLGWYWMDLNEVELAGILETTSIIILILTIAVEALCSMAINLDVVMTLKNSFNRSKNLKFILILL